MRAAPVEVSSEIEILKQPEVVVVEPPSQEITVPALEEAAEIIVEIMEENQVIPDPRIKRKYTKRQVVNAREYPNRSRTRQSVTIATIQINSQNTAKSRIVKRIGSQFHNHHPKTTQHDSK